MSEEKPIAGSSSTAKSLPWNRWVNVLIALILVGLPLALGLPAIQQARKAANHSWVKNNLKHIGLAMMNYHDVHAVFPPGGTVDADGRGHHGWMYQIMPFIDQNSFTHDVDRRVPWDVDINRQRYRLSLNFCRVPGVEEVVTADGFPVTHFMANPAILFRNSSVGISDVENGMSNAWFVGEAGGDYQPWGYPFNWREITGPLNESSSSFGRPEEDGALFVLGDGTVRFYSNRAVDGDRMRAVMLNNPPLPEASRRSRPSQSFDLKDESGLPQHREYLLDDGDRFESLVAKAIVLSDGHVEFVEVRGHYKMTLRSPTLDDVRRAVAKYPTVERLLLPVPLDDSVAELLATLPELTHVYASSVSLSEHGAKTLCGITSLQVLLVEDFDDESAEHIARCHPSFEVRRGNVP